MMKRHRKSHSVDFTARRRIKAPMALTAGPSGCTTTTSKVASGGSHRNGMYENYDEISGTYPQICWVRKTSYGNPPTRPNLRP